MNPWIVLIGSLDMCGSTESFRGVATLLLWKGFCLWGGGGKVLTPLPKVRKMVNGLRNQDRRSVGGLQRSWW